MSISKRPAIMARPAAVAASSRLASASTGPPCRGRSVKKFQTFMKHINNDTTKINILLARALLHDDLLDVFDGHPNANECAFSYPGSDWYSVYLIDEDGNKVWDPEAGHMKLYFKIDIDPSGMDARIDEDSMTNETPDELIDPTTGQEMENCTVSGSSCTGTLPKPKAVAARGSPSAVPAKPRGRPTAVAAAARVTAPMPSSLISPSLLANLEDLNEPVSRTRQSPAAAAVKSKGPEKITRDYFEEMQSKDVIVDWMIKNMSRADLVKCIEKAAISASDVSAAERLMKADETDNEDWGDFESVPSSSGSVERTVAQAAASLPEPVYTRMLKKATKDSIKSQLSKITDPAIKKQEIVNMCNRSGITGYTVAQNKKGVMKIIDEDGEPVDESEVNDVLDKCAVSEAERLKEVIAKMRKQYVRSSTVSEMREIGRRPKSVESIIGPIMAMGSLEDKKRAIVQLCERNGNPDGYTVKQNKKGVLKIYDGDGDPIDEADIDTILMSCAQLEVNQPTSSAGVDDITEGLNRLSIDSIIGPIMALGSPEEKKQAIFEMCQRNGNPNGYTIKQNKKGVLKIYDADDDLVDEGDVDDILTSCAQLELERLSIGSAFGKKKGKSKKATKGKQQTKFASAAKKCKGKKNFRKCMSSALKKKN